MSIIFSMREQKQVVYSQTIYTTTVMNRKKYSNLKWFTKVGILLLYTCFFLGQLNFNYDSGSLVREQLAQSILNAKTKDDCSSVISKTAKPSNSKANLHLNKRFQPESFILGRVICIPLPIEFSCIKNSYFYSNPILSAVSFTTYSLRGPPAIA